MRIRQIEDIFSKKSLKRKKKKETIIIDNREKNSWLVLELRKQGFEIIFKQLKVADYIVKGVAIERKTVHDFISSMKSKRLLKQLQELQQYKKKLLIIEGIDEHELYANDSEYETGMHPNAIRGFLLSILLNHNIPIIFTKNYKDTAQFILILSKKKPKESPLNINKKSLGADERLQFILESFPGIGPKTARKILKKYQTLEIFFTAPENELQEFLGKKAENIIKLKTHKFGDKENSFNVS